MTMLRTVARGVLLAGAATAVGLLAPPLAAAQTQTARLGAVAATLRAGAHGSAILTIARDGRVAYDHAVRAPGPSELRVVHLDVTREPQVLLELVAGRSTFADVFTYEAKRHAYIETGRNFADSPVRLAVLDRTGRVGFVTSDPAFSGRFTDAARSGRPIQVFEDYGGTFAEVTGAFPQLIAHDAAGWLRAYNRTAAENWRDSVGPIAAWAADENELGNMHTADDFLTQEARAGHLNGTRVSGVSFVTALDAFLYRAGYVPMCGGG